MLRPLFFALLTVALMPITPANAGVVIFDTINGYTIAREDRKTCFATIPLLSLNGVRVSFTLFQKSNGKTWQTVSYNEGNRPKKRRDHISLQFDGTELYDRKIKFDKDGIFELPHRTKKQGSMFLNKFAGGERMVVLLRDTKDGFALQLTRSTDVLTVLAACAKEG